MIGWMKILCISADNYPKLESYSLLYYFLSFLFSRGTDNVIGVLSTLRRDDNIVFVLPYFPHQSFQVSA